MSIKHAHEVEAEIVEGSEGISKQVLIPPEEGPNFAMRRFVIEAGGGMPKHFNEVEHEQYVLNGRARIGIGDEVYEVQKDDVVFIPAGVPHWYENAGPENFEFLCMVPNLPDQPTILG